MRERCKVTMKFVFSAILVLVGLINLTPAVGVLGANHLFKLYGVRFDDPNMLILMRHRAVLFGMLGVFLVASVWRPAWQNLAIGATLVSMVSFVFLAWATGKHNTLIRRVVWIDIVASVALLAGAAISVLVPAH
jgi:hypothetical protein